MHVPLSFTENVAMKFRLYSGLFFDLPYESAKSDGTLLPLFTQFCREELSKGRRPDELVEEFFTGRMGVRDFGSIRDALFGFVRLAERQIVLFDAAEDAGFLETRDMDGPGSLHEASSRIESQGLGDAAAALMDEMGVRIVLTAHPTQFYTEAVLGIISQLREAIRGNNVQEVNRLLLQLGRTKFKKKEKPTPFDEAKAILWFMENVLYDVVPEVQTRLLSSAGIHGEEALTRKALLELGFWPGGDRDGNPNVTPEITRQVGELLRQSILGLYLRDVAELQRRLTFDGVMESLEVLRIRLENTRRSFGGCEDAPEKDRGPFRDAGDLLEFLKSLRGLLTREHQGLFVEDLDRFITKVAVFGFHFGILDLRQDSRILSKTLDQVFQVLEGPGQGGYSSLDDAGRLQRLSRVNEAAFTGKIRSVLGALQDPVLRDCLEVFQAAREIQGRNGAQGVHRFIVSNTRGPSDILALRLLSIVSGMDPESVPLDFVPLFETVDDLSGAGDTMTTLWNHPLYRRHLEQRGGVQHIMLGFSDGTKDGGYLSANWGIYRAKQQLTRLAEEKGYRLVFFDGRGGPPARGGGNTHKFYRSLGRDIEGRSIHLTIQGQTISSNYGNRHSARYNLEQLASAALDNYLYPQNEDWHLEPSEAALLDELSEISHQAYTSLRDDPEFLPYLEHLSPLRYYSQANNSSRPAKRPGGGALTLGDLRAIPFVGAWSQLKLNIPGYFGLGTALEALEKAGRITELRALYQGSLYFRTLVENSMQSLSKVSLPLTAWIGKDPRFASFHGRLKAEAERTVRMLLAVSGQEELLGQDPLNRASIRMREDMIAPISVIQQYALMHLRRLQDKVAGTAVQPSDQDAPLLEKLIVKSMAACVNASRNSV